MNIAVFGAISVVLLVSLFGMSSLTGWHHVPTEQVVVVEKFPYAVSIAKAEARKTCVTPARDSLEAGHCWWYAREDRWLWCRPKLVNKYSGAFVPDSAVDEDFENLVRDSMLGIVGVQLVRALPERCVHFEGWDVYR